ncbi:CRISPR-associated protein Cas2 [Paenibacillus tundrae]|uniref:CRISPR-associated protein Cas2 n=1 Tax=Paenibacillus tundrae TaxID=528187 RepID=A0ABT9WET0_9BACL|nr:CRISPR-associated protein Cas2 [Paenibacillus tundrae]
MAKKCVDYGQRVQNSVFECMLDAAQFKKLQLELESMIDKKTDSLRFYNLGDNYKSKVRHVGAKASYDMGDTLIL